MNGLEMNWEWDAQKRTGLGFAKANVWSRSARRKKKTAEQEQTLSVREADEDIDADAALGVRITLLDDGQTLVRWLLGADAVLFESFCGMLKRELASR